jgi:hypothetical protein
MTKFLWVALIALVLGQAPVAQAQSANLTGEWHGVYFDGNQLNTAFDVDLVQSGNRITGTTVEPNNFGTADARFLLATIQGSVSPTHITFVKTYDGTGGQSHAVHYVGQLMPNGRRIVGTWSLAGGTQGRFEMVR